MGDCSANREESLRCLGFAKAALSAGDVDKAERLLRKACRLDAANGCPEAQRLLDEIAVGGHRGPGGENAGAEARRRRTSSGASAGGHAEKQFTDEQASGVTRIRQAKDYYEILGVAKDATDDDLKRSYRKLALKFHPDKNKAPGAQEAFKAIGNAYSVLADPAKRKRYDMYGSEEEQAARRHGNGSGAGYYYEDYSRGFEADVSPEEIFNMFFGGGFPSYDLRRGRGRRHHQHDGGARAAETAGRNVYSMLLQFAPIFLLMLMSLLSGFMQRDPWYNLAASNIYSDSRHTRQSNVPYYVKPNFHSEFTGSLAQLEAEIEDEFFHNLRVKCYRERSYKESMQFRARYYQDSQAYKIASKLTTPHCDMLQKYGG